MKYYLLAQFIFISSLMSSLGAQAPNQFTPALNSTALPEHSASITSKEDHNYSDQLNPDSISENTQLLLRSRYEALDHSPLLKIETREGQRYVGSNKGISVWDGYSNLSFTTDNSGIPENNVTALALDGKNNLWIGTNSKGIVKGIGNPFKPYKTKIIPTHDLEIYSIVSEESGDIWVTYRDGSFEYFQNGLSKAYFLSTKSE